MRESRRGSQRRSTNGAGHSITVVHDSAMLALCLVALPIKEAGSKAKNDKERHMEIEDEISLVVPRGNELHDVLAPYQSAQLSPADTVALCLFGWKRIC